MRKIGMKSFEKTNSNKTVRMNVSMERLRPRRVATVMLDDLQIVIPYRDSKLTKAALKYVSELIEGQNVRVRLIDVHVVPYGVPLDQPTVDPKHLERRLKNAARDSELPVSAEVVYARDWEQGFRRVLTPGSTVLLPMRRVWWRTSEKRFAARLRKLGHTVVWVECD
jgi:hypothetical protein